MRVVAARDFQMEERQSRSQGKGGAYKISKSSSPVGDLAKDSRDDDRRCCCYSKKRRVQGGKKSCCGKEVGTERGSAFCSPERLDSNPSEVTKKPFTTTKSPFSTLCPSKAKIKIFGLKIRLVLCSSPTQVRRSLV